ncbi:regulation of nuclear pre-mRNA domain-containing protein 2a [Stigmatopora nigra]
MAAASGRDSSASFEAVLEKKLINLTNTMDSIQGLSTWCIDHKKHHNMIVRQWSKCLKTSDTAHKLNLFYLANDVIQNCKRKNAIVYRATFADVLPEAFVLLKKEKDAKMVKSVERILSIWQERSVYTDVLIAELRNSFVKEESPPVTPLEQKTPVESKADLRSKIVAEFVPQSLVDQLSKYKRSMDDVDLREKQLAAMRVDICSSDALKKLKDKAGGKKFSRDFEEGNTQLQEFVKFFDKQNKAGPLLLETLGNADIFYEMQYKEVKIVANAYQTFANRVSHLKRKLDNLKATLPDLDESPLPSPSADAPSPTGSESPFHDLELAKPHSDLDGFAMEDEAEPPAPSPLSSIGDSPKQVSNSEDNVNREVEDMDLSDEEIDSGNIIVEEQIKDPSSLKVFNTNSKNTEPSIATAQHASSDVTSAATPTGSVGGVDLGKIGSILNSLNEAMKNTGPPVESPSAANPHSSVQTIPPASEDAPSLVEILAKVDMSPAELLSALSKVQSQGGLDGISSLLSSPAPNVPAKSSNTGKSRFVSSFTPVSEPTDQSSTPSFTAMELYSPSNAHVQQSQASQMPTEVMPITTPLLDIPRDMKITAPLVNIPRDMKMNAPLLDIPRDMKITAIPTETTTTPSSLESKIHTFLQGNPSFNTFDLGFTLNLPNRVDNLSPVTGTDTQDGTPVRDEGGGTPTQDEAMDIPVGLPNSSSTRAERVLPATFGFQESNTQNREPTNLQRHLQPDVAQNGQLYQPYPFSEHKISDSVSQYQDISIQSGGPPTQGTQGMGNPGWYGETYPDGGFQQSIGYNEPMSANNQTKTFEYQAEKAGEHQGFQQSSDFFSNLLPPVPKLPPPPSIVPQISLPEEEANTAEPCQSRVIPRMVVHEHGHKSTFRPDDSMYDEPDDELSTPEDMNYQEDNEHYHPTPRFKTTSYIRPEVPFFQRGSPRHNLPRGRGHFTSPPPRSHVDAFNNQDFQEQSPRGHFAPRRPPPPHHFQMRPTGMRPPFRGPRFGPHPFPRGPPRTPFPNFHGPDPRLMGKRPGPRGGLNPGPMFTPKRPFLPPRY